VRGHANFPEVILYPSVQVAGSEPADCAELLVLCSLSLIYMLGKKFPKHCLRRHSAAGMPDLPSKRTRTMNPKLLDDDNVSTDAISKCCKVAASKSVTNRVAKVQF
jgi:hypothetical protein